ncbi:trans-sialidase [Trypanosoma cruzi]|nr:trans-sialidase [Trypanosoma cruzi]
MHSHSHFLNGACFFFSEASSVRQRDRGTRLAVAGVLSGTALECRVPGVGLSPRWGRLSGIVSRLLLNAVAVVDGQSLMGGRECACRRVISHSGNSLGRCMCVCLADVVFWIPISRYSVPQKWTGRWCSHELHGRGGNGYASLWRTRANSGVLCGLGPQGRKKQWAAEGSCNARGCRR